MFAYHLSPTPRRLRVRFGDHWVLDTRGAKVAFVHGASPFYLVPRADLRAQLVPRDTETDDWGRLHDVRLPDGTPLPLPAVVYPAREGFVRLDPRDPRTSGARWRDGEEPLQWLEEDQPAFPFARHPSHRVEVLPLSEQARIEREGEPVATSHDAVLVLETGLPARVYVPETDFVAGRLHPCDDGRTVCPYKGVARYFDLRLPQRTLPRAAWGYDTDDDDHNWQQPRLHRRRAVAAEAGFEIYLGEARLGDT